MNCFKKPFWPWKLSDTIAHEDGKRNTIVWHFFCMSGSSKLHGMGSVSNISVLECLIGEEERLCWLVFEIVGPDNRNDLGPDPEKSRWEAAPTLAEDCWMKEKSTILKALDARVSSDFPK